MYIFWMSLLIWLEINALVALLLWDRKGRT